MPSSSLSHLFWFCSSVTRRSKLSLIWTETFSRKYFCLLFPTDCQLTQTRTMAKPKYPSTTALLPVVTELIFPGILLDLHLQSLGAHQNNKWSKAVPENTQIFVGYFFVLVFLMGVSELYVNSSNDWLVNTAYSKHSVQTSKEQA